MSLAEVFPANSAGGRAAIVARGASDLRHGEITEITKRAMAGGLMIDDDEHRLARAGLAPPLHGMRRANATG
jgi:hypothetical protein